MSAESYRFRVAGLIVLECNLAMHAGSWFSNHSLLFVCQIVLHNGVENNDLGC